MFNTQRGLLPASDMALYLSPPQTPAYCYYLLRKRGLNENFGGRDGHTAIPADNTLYSLYRQGSAQMRVAHSRTNLRHWQSESVILS